MFYNLNYRIESKETQFDRGTGREEICSALAPNYNMPCFGSEPIN